MRITELITKETIAMDLSATTQDGVIVEFEHQLNYAGKLNKLDDYNSWIHRRVQKSSAEI
ncbi:hypothetical protein DV965_15945 [Staphylococcus pseudintermedius]|uniref:hypothetical protein n=1 Tax=Staphylococcus pseudintermedius TaxID=283734 RepID=UPI000E3873E0|nr:hypothetical protein [Staphylococcus pseudintermedius]REB90529.1 hypothetical protein DV965_15945 [Staphylococcus pseudintermedius]